MDKEQKEIEALAEKYAEAMDRLQDSIDYNKRVQDAIGKAVLKRKTARESMERAVAKTEQASEARKDKKTPAKDTDEFILKYSQKRFTPANTGKAYLLDFLFDVYKGNSKQVNTTLWNVELLRGKIKTEEDMRSFDAYYHLTEWLRSLYETSRATQKALRSALSDFTHITTSIIAAEHIRQAIIDEALTQELTTLQQFTGEPISERIKGRLDIGLVLWLNSISLEAYTPQNDGGILLQSLRENIGEGLRYIVAYHTFLDVIAEFTGIPECAFLKVRMKPINDHLSVLNEALECLRENTKAYREPEVRKAAEADPDRQRYGCNFILSDKDFLPASLTAWTPEYLNKTMEYFKPIEGEPPVPEERIDFLRSYIRREFKTGIINWYVLYTWYSVKYRIPYPTVTPPIAGQRTPHIKAKISDANMEEGE